MSIARTTTSYERNRDISHMFPVPLIDTETADIAAAPPLSFALRNASRMMANQQGGKLLPHRCASPITMLEIKEAEPGCLDT